MVKNESDGNINGNRLLSTSYLRRRIVGGYRSTVNRMHRCRPDNLNLTFPLAIRNLVRVKGYKSSLVRVTASIALWVACAGVVRVQGNAAVGEAGVPLELISPDERHSGATLIAAAGRCGTESP